MDNRVSVQTQDFSVADEYAQLSAGTQAGAVVTFVGKVRDTNHAPGLYLDVLDSANDPATVIDPQRQAMFSARPRHIDGFF